jgi:S-adenosylmethionine:tRNA ribosyltransferase-isomerase
METKKNRARIEFFLRELNSEQRLWDVLVDPARKIRIGNKLYFGDDDSLVAEVIDNTTSREEHCVFFTTVLTKNLEIN